MMQFQLLLLWKLEQQEIISFRKKLRSKMNRHAYTKNDFYNRRCILVNQYCCYWPGSSSRGFEYVIGSMMTPILHETSGRIISAWAEEVFQSRPIGVSNLRSYCSRLVYGYGTLSTRYFAAYRQDWHRHRHGRNSVDRHKLTFLSNFSLMMT